METISGSSAARAAIAAAIISCVDFSSVDIRKTYRQFNDSSRKSPFSSIVETHWSLPWQLVSSETKQ